MRKLEKSNPLLSGRVWMLVAGGAALLALTLGGYFLARKPKPPEEVPAWLDIKHVRSGDTVVLGDGEKAIYRGIRAPIEGEPLFEEARKRNEELVGGKEVRARFERDDERDKKQRLQAYAFVDTKLINAELVREGLAYARLTADTARFNQEILAASTTARKSGRGLWALPAPSPETDYWADPKYALFHRASCAEKAKAKAERIQAIKTRGDAFDRGWAPCPDCKP